MQRIEFNVSPLQLEIGKVYKETKMLLDGEKEEEWTFEVKNMFSLIKSDKESQLLMVALHI